MMNEERHFSSTIVPTSVDNLNKQCLAYTSVDMNLTIYRLTTLLLYLS